MCGKRSDPSKGTRFDGSLLLYNLAQNPCKSKPFFQIFKKFETDFGVDRILSKRVGFDSLQSIIDLNFEWHVTLSGTEPPPPDRFTDVPPTAWFHDAVAFVYDEGIMRGASETTFDPLADFNRAQIPASPAASRRNSPMRVRLAPGQKQLWPGRSIRG